MLEITCYDNDGKKLDHLTQWDMGQTVSVKGATYIGSPVFHFCNRRSYRAYAVESTTQDDSISAKIPNALLKEPYPIEAYMYYQREPGSAKTVYAFSIPVTPRKQPDDYIFTDNIDVISLIEIKKEMMAALEELRAAIQDSKDSIVQVTTVIDEAKAATQEATSASASANAAAETAAQATTDARTAAQEAGHATEAATQAATAAGQATTSATNAAQSATDAANKANTAAGRADTAIQDATTAAGNANTATESATTAAGKADASAGKADAATAKANDAATAATGASEKANTAATQATDAAKTATDATATATSAASKADAAATAANEASAKANQAATEAITAKNEATTAASTATEAAGRADTATQGANTAADAANAAAKAANDAAEKAKIDVAGKLDKPTAAPKVNDVLKVESVNPDGSFNAVWSEPPATVVVDETLQNAGQAADAAKTGEELKKLDKNKENVIVKSAFGTSIVLDDSIDSPFAGLRLFGRTEQNGIPSPDSPVPLVSPGDDGNIGISVMGKNMFDLDAFTSTSDVNVEVADNFVTLTALTSRWYTNVTTRVSLFPNTVYVFSADVKSDSPSPWRKVRILDKAENELSNGLNRLGDGHLSGQFATRSDGTVIIEFGVNYEAGGQRITYSNIQIETGISETSYDTNKQQSIPISTPNGLPGIKVDDGGNYIDSTGQRWICDEVNFEKRQYVQRILQATLDGSVSYGFLNENVWHFGNKALMDLFGKPIKKNMLCNLFRVQHNSYAGVGNESESKYYNTLYVSTNASDMTLNAKLFPSMTEEGFREYFSQNPMIIYAESETPIFHNLSGEELAAYKNLHTNYPNTNILNDEGCEMSVSYFTDTEVGKYIGELSRSSVRTDPATKSPITLGYDDGGLYIMTE